MKIKYYNAGKSLLNYQSKKNTNRLSTNVVGTLGDTYKITVPTFQLTDGTEATMICGCPNSYDAGWWTDSYTGILNNYNMFATLDFYASTEGESDFTFSDYTYSVNDISVANLAGAILEDGVMYSFSISNNSASPLAIKSFKARKRILYTMEDYTRTYKYILPFMLVLDSPITINEGETKTFALLFSRGAVGITEETQVI